MIRLLNDRRIVAAKLPRNTTEMTVSGITGWRYSITSQLKDRYKMFTYFDGSLYQVMVIDPDVAGRYGIHDTHLFGDGKICLNQERGYPTLEQAFAKSVLWANGFSIFLKTNIFPFSNNN